MMRRKYLLLATFLIMAIGNHEVGRTAEDQSMDAYLRMQSQSKQFELYGEKIIALLTAGDNKAFKKQLSDCLVKSAGPVVVDAQSQRIVSFFADFKKPGNSMSVFPTTDPCGNQGFSIYKSFIANNGSEKYFALYVVTLDGKMAVANLVPDKTPPQSQ